MVIYRFKIKNYQFVARYQANVPVAGVMFSPNYGQSYYEIFTLGNSEGVIKFTSLNNQPSIRQLFSLDFPVGCTKIRLNYLWDIQQSKVNKLKTHTYSHIFMLFIANINDTRNLLRLADSRDITERTTKMNENK